MKTLRRSEYLDSKWLHPSRLPKFTGHRLWPTTLNWDQGSLWLVSHLELRGLQLGHVSSTA